MYVCEEKESFEGVSEKGEGCSYLERESGPQRGLLWRLQGGMLLFGRRVVSIAVCIKYVEHRE